jgi:hypothetical protein
LTVLYKFTGDKFDLTPYESTWLILHVFGGQIALPILVLTALISKKVHAHPALINFWATWVRHGFALGQRTDGRR